MPHGAFASVPWRPRRAKRCWRTPTCSHGLKTEGTWAEELALHRSIRMAHAFSAPEHGLVSVEVSVRCLRSSPWQRDREREQLADPVSRVVELAGGGHTMAKQLAGRVQLQDADVSTFVGEDTIDGPLHVARPDLRLPPGLAQLGQRRQQRLIRHRDRQPSELTGPKHRAARRFVLWQSCSSRRPEVVGAALNEAISQRRGRRDRACFRQRPECR